MILLSLLLLASSLYAQPDTIIYYDANWKPRVFKDSASFYRVIIFDADSKPVGEVRDYYITNTLQWKGRLLSVDPDIMDGRCVWYKENGEIQNVAFYREGAEIKIADSIAINGYAYVEDPTEWLKMLSNEWKVELGMDRETGFFIHKTGRVLYGRQEYDYALNFWQLATYIRREMGLESDLARSMNNIGLTYYNKGNLEKALEYHFQAKEIRERLDLNTGLASSLNNIGLLDFGQQCCVSVPWECFKDRKVLV